MNMMEAMKQSEAVEISLKNGHVVYGRFLGVSDGNIIVCDPDGAVVFVPVGADNLSYVKIVSPDPEISRLMDRLFGARPSRRPVAEPAPAPEPEAGRQLSEDEIQSPRRVDVQPIILAGPPSNRQAAIEAVKEKFRHGTSFASPATRPAFRPRIETEDEEE
jgi:hypothetical protein